MLPLLAIVENTTQIGSYWEQKKFIGEKQEVVLADISTLSYPVFVTNKNAYHRQEHPHLELKTLPGFSSVCLSLSMTCKLQP
jgi:hypothetical protein